MNNSWLVVRDILGYLKRYFISLAEAYLKSSAFKKFGISDYNKKSDTFFIFGTGMSINDMRTADFEKIKKYDSYSDGLFNTHSFTTDIYAFECFHDFNLIDHLSQQEEAQYRPFTSSRYFEAWKKAMSGKLLNGKTKVILTSDTTIRELELSENHEMKRFVYKDLKDLMYVYNLMSVSCRTGQSLIFLDLLRKIIPDRLFMQVRGSISTFIDFAVRRKFANIVLCGIDLDDAGNFYGSWAPPSGKNGKHWTSIRQDGIIGIDEYIKFIAKKHKNIHFYTWSAKSRLSAFMDVFSWEKLSSKG
ncbi:MAG: hypothetical protein FP827_06205 [Candidatus Omnitrophica bacterium]|nr:hypothetical protein [Candidatus Omnitrophota bacterium]MBU3929182.1 hypothetical protein [bacterium]